MTLKMIPLLITTVVVCHSFIVQVQGFQPPKYVNMGLIGPQFTVHGDPNIAGRHAIAATIMALREIKNKSDGILDHVLPNTDIRIAFRSPRQNFLEAVGAALELSSSAFNGTGIMSLIGTSATDSSKATAESFSNTNFKIPQISYGAESSELGHAIYSHFSRVCPSDAYQGRIIARLVKKYFGWATVTVFSSGDTFGNDITLEFETEAKLQGGIDIESRYSFWSGITDFTDVIQSAKDKGGVLKIFLFFMKSHDAGLLMEQGYNMGLFKEGTQIIGTEYMFSTDVVKVMSPDADVGKIMKGAIAIGFTMARKRKANSLFQSFVKRYRAQKPTMISDNASNNNMAYCDLTKDDDNKEYLYMGHADGHLNSPLVCAGIDFDTLLEDGSEISDIAIFAYDATMAMALALHQVIYIDQAVNITGDMIRNAIVYNVSFDGLSGSIHFNPGGPGFETYGKGDRLGGNDFMVYNFNPQALHRQADSGASAWFEVGIFTYLRTFEPCNMNADLRCSHWIFNTKDNSPPVDMAPVEEIQMGDASRVGLRVGGAMALFLVMIFVIIIQLCADTKLVKASQPMMMKSVLLGATLACIRVILATVDVNDAVCVAGKWLGHMSFAFAFGALIMKIWRVDAVVNSGFRKVKITARQVEYMLLFCLFVFSLYLLADTLYSQPHLSYEETFDGHTLIRLMKCTNKSQSMTVFLYVFEGTALVAGARLCWSTKDVPDAVNDSRYIAMSMYLIVFVCSVTFPIVYFKIDPTPALLLMVMAVGFIVATVGSVIMLFGPKAKLLWDGHDVDENFAIVKQDATLGPVNKLVALKMRVSSAHSSETRTSLRKESSMCGIPSQRNSEKIVSTIQRIGGIDDTTNNSSGSRVKERNIMASNKCRQSTIVEPIAEEEAAYAGEIVHKRRVSNHNSSAQDKYFVTDYEIDKMENQSNNSQNEI